MARKTPITRQDFGVTPSGMELPNLLDVQLKAYEDFLQARIEPEKRNRQGLQMIFEDIFPITDIRENHTLEFISYSLGTKRYSIEECQDRNMTFAAPLKANLRLVSREGEGKEKQVKDIIEQEVYLGELPIITRRGTFVINGSERVIVSQLHRSPGVFFDEGVHANGKQIFSSRIIPYRGSWVEFEVDVGDVMHVHIDSRRKMHATVLMRAIGYSSNEEILELFYNITPASLTGKKAMDITGHYAAESIVDKETGEVILKAGETIAEAHVERLAELKIKKLKIIEVDEHHEAYVIINTLAKDVTSNREEALSKIYTLLRPGEPPTLEMAKSLLERLFFNASRYDLGEVGRYMINQRLGQDIPLEQTTLDKKDFVSIIRYLIDLRNGHGFIDDIDHLGNRRARTVGELLSNLFSVGLSRVARNIRERMSLRNDDPITPQGLVNARTVSSVIDTFFGSSQLSQFMDQTNPLSELTHKRRLSALGPGGLTRERAGFEVRDVHHTHYGRLCPVETPEGPNIGLIASLATYARINRYGFIETPYRKIKKGKFSGDIEYLTADEEDRHTIAQANEPLDSKGNLVDKLIVTRHRDDYPVVPPEEVEYMDVSPRQLVSVAASLIPFLEHDDANRALMGSNMQRQALPLLRTEAPMVGTGMEKKAATDAGVTIIARRAGSVLEVDARKIVIRPHLKAMPDELGFYEDDIYNLTKFKRSNQDTCLNQKPIVEVGDKVEKGDVLADGPATDRGELALGHNVLVAFMPWLGYNFEDAIILSERLIKDDIYTSIHIEEFELQVRDTKRGSEEVTREIPNVSEEALLNLDENGIIRIGAEVESGDILVGKVTPKGETELSPEERLLRAIFGEKAGDVRDASLKAPPGMHGIVIDSKVFARKERSEETKKYEKQTIARVRAQYNKLFLDVAAHRNRRLGEILNDKSANTVRSIIDNSVVIRAGHKYKSEGLVDFDFDMVVAPDGFTTEAGVNKRVDKIVTEASTLLAEKRAEMEVEIDKVERGAELAPGVKQLVKVQVAIRRKVSVGDKMAGRHGNKGVVSRIVPVEDMPYLEDGTPVDIILNPLGVPSRMNIGQLLETHLGLAAKKLGLHYANPVFEGASLEQIKGELKKAGADSDGKAWLWDGRTSERFDNRVTVGYIYMLKLSHLVDDKIHARSIGPYSLVTQQPLGGKAQFGGQRFGEMEVWALEAYGAAYTLQEMLTVKSDDVAGRSKIYEAIVKGENPPEPGVPESFNVLIKELQALGLDVTLLEKT